jgi:uncharacterized protein YndB with AHSA1/START domain
MNSRPIVVEETMNTNPGIIWKALTDNNEIREWYFKLKSFEPRAGFEFQFEGGNDGRTYIHHCRITEVIPEKKLSYTWKYQGYEGISEVSFELFPEGNKTKIRLTHTGIESFPLIPDFKRENFVEGWNSIIRTSLKNYVERVGVRG